MKKSFAVAVVLAILASSSLTLNHGSAQSETIPSLTGEIGYSTQSQDAPQDGLAPADTVAGQNAVYLPAVLNNYQRLPGPVAGALYGTDGLNLYIIDKTTGAATLIGPHGPVETAIGALAFDSNGTLYGTSVTSTARLYTINPTTGAATAVGALGIGSVFEGGLDFDAAGQLFGVNQGNAFDAKAYTIDTATGAATVLGPTPGESRDIDGLAFDGQTFYAIERVSNTLGTMDPGTGAYTPIGGPGVTIGNSGGLAADPVDGTLYATFSATGGFYSLNKTTGVATLIGDNGADYGLAFAPLNPLAPLNP
jgi:hypothetical protein